MHFNVRFLGKTISKDGAKFFKIGASFAEAGQIRPPKSFKAELRLAF